MLKEYIDPGLVSFPCPDKDKCEAQSTKEHCVCRNKIDAFNNYLNKGILNDQEWEVSFDEEYGGEYKGKKLFDRSGLEIRVGDWLGIGNPGEEPTEVGRVIERNGFLCVLLPWYHDKDKLLPVRIWVYSQSQRNIVK